MIQILAGLIGVQVFFLASRAMGAGWQVFAPGSFGRGGSAVMAVALTLCCAILLLSRGGPVGWGAVFVLLLWFLLLSLVRDEAEQLLWRPVAALCVIAAIIVQSLG